MDNVWLIIYLKAGKNETERRIRERKYNSEK